MKFYSFSSLEQNIKDQVRMIRTHPLVPKEVPISGLVYEVESGKLRRITG
jgi:carbonic anhydrase